MAAAICCAIVTFFIIVGFLSVKTPPAFISFSLFMLYGSVAWGLKHSEYANETDSYGVYFFAIGATLTFIGYGIAHLWNATGISKLIAAKTAAIQAETDRRAKLGKDILEMHEKWNQNGGNVSFPKNEIVESKQFEQITA